MRKNILTLLVLALGLLLIAPACHIHADREADVRLYWSFDDRGCHWAGVSEVEIILEKESSGRSYHTGLMNCSADWVDIEDIDAGRYVIYAYGYRPGARHPRWALERRVRLHRGFNEFTLVLEPY